MSDPAALFIPIIGNVMVRLAGVPLGRSVWPAARANGESGPWPQRSLPARFIFIVPSAAIGWSAQRFGVTPLVVWDLWGAALFALLWVAPLLRRVEDQPFCMAHWGMSFPMAAFSCGKRPRAP